MLPKLLLILSIIILITLLLFIKSSRRRLWQRDNTLHSRIITLRSVVLIGVIILFLVFTLFR